MQIPLVIMAQEYGMMKQAEDMFVIGNPEDASIIRIKPIVQFAVTKEICPPKAHTARFMSIGGAFGNL